MTTPDKRTQQANGPAIETLRQARGLTLEKLAARADTSDATIKRALRGQRLRLSNLCAIANALNVELSAIGVPDQRTKPDESQPGEATHITPSHIEARAVYQDDVATLCPSFELVPHSADCISPSSADFFYDGFAPTWPELAARFDIHRHAYSANGALHQALSALLKKAGVSLLSITGVAGSGKTTLLRRIGFDLADNNLIVFRLREDVSPLNLTAQLASVAKRCPDPIVILIDNAGDLIFENDILDKTMRELRHSCTQNSVLLICAEETSRWLAALRRRPLSVAHSTALYDLLPTECESLVDTIMHLEADQKLTVITALSRDERLSLCEMRAKRQLLVAMLQIRHGEEFNTILRREFERIPSASARQAYALTCQFNSLGLSLPERVLLDAVGIDSAPEMAEFDINTDQLLIIDRNMRVSARHPVIARTVARHAFPTARSRQAALLQVLQKLNSHCLDEQEVFRGFFTQRTVYRTLVVLFDRDIDLLRQFYKALRFSVKNRWPLDYTKYIATAEALTMQMLGDDRRAEQCLIEATTIDPNFEFAIRQHAWFEHSQGHWDEAARLAARAASLAPDNFDTVYQCGRILSLGNVRNFRSAKPYLIKAQVLDPTHKKCGKTWEGYCEAEIIMGHLTSINEEDIVPEYAMRQLRPGLRFFRACFGVNDPLFRHRLRGKLKSMEEEVRGNVGELYEVLSGVDPKNPTDKALISCNLGRLLYLEWYHRGEPHTPDYIESVFKRSLEFNSRDPFAHCWYGTFLKEVRRDFTGARREYETALRIGNSSGDDRNRNHPLFLNNIGLLALDQVQAGRLPPAALPTARESFVTAMRRTAELNIDFDWPQQSLERCDALMHEYGLPPRPNYEQKK